MNRENIMLQIEKEMIENLKIKLLETGEHLVKTFRTTTSKLSAIVEDAEGNQRVVVLKSYEFASR